MENDNNKSKHKEKYSVNHYDKNDFLIGFDKYIKTPGVLCFRGCVVLVHHYEQNTLGNDWTPFLNASSTIGRDCYCEGFYEIITSADSNLCKWHLQGLESCLATVSSERNEFALVQVSENTTEGS